MRRARNSHWVFFLSGDTSLNPFTTGQFMKLQKSFISMAEVLMRNALASPAAAQAPFKIDNIIFVGTRGDGDATARVRNGNDQELVVRFRDFDVYGESKAGDRAVTNSN